MKMNARVLPVVGFLGILIGEAIPATAGMENVRFCLHRKDMFTPTEAVPSACDNPATPTVEPNFGPNFDNLGCDQYSVTAPLGPSTVYLVVARAGEEGVRGVSFGVSYDGSDPDQMPGTGDETGILSSQTTWTSCANGLAFPMDGGNGEFPASSGSVRLLWDTNSCQTETVGGDGVYAIVGCFHVYAYSSAVMSLTSNLNLKGKLPTGPSPQIEIPELLVLDCLGNTTNLGTLHPLELIAALPRVQFGVGSSGYNPCSNLALIHPTTWGALKHLYR